MKKKNLVGTAVLALSALALLASCGGGDASGSGSGGSDPRSSSQAATYAITVDAPEGVNLKGLPESAAEGDRVSFTIEITAAGAVVDKVTVNGEAVTPSSTGRYRFDMPAGAVTIKVTLASVSAVRIDTAAVRKSYIKNATFSSEGLKVFATIGSEEKEITSGYEVSSPDMLTVGKKTVTVSYAGKSAEFEIFVGDLETKDIDIEVRENKVYFKVLGDYSAFENIAGLNEAAKGMFMADFQFNNNIGAKGWDRVYESNEIVFVDAGAGKWAVEIDVTDFEGAGDGIGYTLHFGLPQGAGGVIGQESDAGHAGDMKFPAGTEHPNDGKVVELNGKSYTISANAGADTSDPLKFWGCCGLIVKDSDAKALEVDSVAIETTATSATVVFNGHFNKFEPTNENIADQIFVDMMQFNTWATVQSQVEMEFVTDGIVADKGNFTFKIDVTDKLDSSNDYFFHFHFAEGATATSDHPNLSWKDSFTEARAVDPVNQGVITMRRKVDGDSWMHGLVSVNFLGGDYVLPDSVNLANKENKAVFSVGGIYSNIVNNDNEDYYLDCMDFASNVDISNGGQDAVLTVTPENVGDSKGRFEVALDVTGKLTEGNEYYFHFGPLPVGSEYRNNLKAPASFTEPVSVSLGDGTYTLKIASGYTESSETWRNGLAVLTFVAK